MFPKGFITSPPEDSFLQHPLARICTDAKLQTHLSTLTDEQYQAGFKKRPSDYDLHEQHFQDWTVKKCKQKPVEELRALSTSRNHVNKRILRAFIYAICTRDDLDWKGNAIEAEEQQASKREERLSIWKSLKLYNWMCGDAPAVDCAVDPPKELSQWTCSVDVQNIDTQAAVASCAKTYPDARIGWLNMANAHNCCGTYNVNYGGSQEEEVAPNSTACATLGLVATAENNLRAKLTGENHIEYKTGYHIPAGGNFFADCKFITCEPQVDCHMIATAFADFRSYIPIFRPHSERSKHFGWFGSVRDSGKLDERLKIDLHGVCKTAVQEKLDVLVLGASGCGAFRHDPEREAKLWRDVLAGYQHHFKHVLFAILEDPKSPLNVSAFQQAFKQGK